MKNKNRSINVKEVSFPDFSTGEKDNKDSSVDYTHLLMDVPLDVRVEIGKTKMTLRDVLQLGQGSIIRLEKQAGAPVDIIANNQTVAKGDVMVIDDYFTVRITEIITSKKFIKNLKKDEESVEKEEVVSEETHQEDIGEEEENNN